MRSSGWLIFKGASGFFSHGMTDITDVDAKTLGLHVEKKEFKGFANRWK